MRPSFNISNFAKVKHTGYQYDALGRNTLIPAADAPNSNGSITLTYNTNDQVTSILQAGNSTTFSYDAEGRRLNETAAGVATTRHYTDSSDNPTWTTQTGSNAKTEIYTPSLGTGLNVTTTIQAGVATRSMQLHDLRGNTVTNIDLTNNTATTWCSYDEFGNPDTTNPTNTSNINYTTYGQAERATNTTGLILMGARVYNPETNQFTSPDPVKGGNENNYCYPNEFGQLSDFNGLFPGNGPNVPPGPYPISPELDNLIHRINGIQGSKTVPGEYSARLVCEAIKFLLCGQSPTFSSDPKKTFLKYEVRQNGKLLYRVRVSIKNSTMLEGKLVANFQSGFKANPKATPDNNAHVVISGNGGNKAGVSELTFIEIQLGGGGVGRVH